MASTIEIPEPARRRLQAEADRRGLTVGDLVVDLAAHLPPAAAISSPPSSADAAAEAFAAFIGCGDSGDPDWATREGR